MDKYMPSLEQLETTQKEQGKEIQRHETGLAVMETMVTEMSRHTIKVEEALKDVGVKLDRIHDDNTILKSQNEKMQEFQDDLSEVKTWITANKPQIKKWIKRDEENAGLWKKYGFQVAMMILVAAMGVYVKVATMEEISVDLTSSELTQLLEEYAEEKSSN